MALNLLISGIHVGASEEQACVPVACHPFQRRRCRPLAFVIRCIQHQVRVTTSQQHPVKEFRTILHRVRRRTARNLESQQLTIKSNRERHIEYLQQRAKTSNINQPALLDLLLDCRAGRHHRE